MLLSTLRNILSCDSDKHMLLLLACSLKDVQKRTENVNTEVDPSGWRPYHTFVNTLQEKCAKNEGL